MGLETQYGDEIMSKHRKQLVHILPTTPFDLENNPFGVIPEGIPIDWETVTQARVDAVDKLYPCSVIAKARISHDPSIEVKLQSNDFLGSLAQIRDQGIDLPIVGVLIDMTVDEWDLWARLINYYIAKGNKEGTR
jgi:hypothetical protein